MNSPEVRRLIEQVDELAEDRIKRNAEIARLRKALIAIAAGICLPDCVEGRPTCACDEKIASAALAGNTVIPNE